MQLAAVQSLPSAASTAGPPAALTLSAAPNQNLLEAVWAVELATTAGEDLPPRSIAIVPATSLATTPAETLAPRLVDDDRQDIAFDESFATLTDEDDSQADSSRPDQLQGSLLRWRQEQRRLGHVLERLQDPAPEDDRASRDEIESKRRQTPPQRAVERPPHARPSGAERAASLQAQRSIADRMRLLDYAGDPNFDEADWLTVELLARPAAAVDMAEFDLPMGAYQCVEVAPPRSEATANREEQAATIAAEAEGAKDGAL